MKLDFVEGFFRKHAPSTTPSVHSEASIEEPSTPSPSGLDAPLTFLPTTPNKKRVRKRNFAFFVDTNLAEVPLGPATQRSKRTPLGIRADSANSTPSPSPQLPATPYSLSPGDCFWIDKENWDPAPLPTPPPTPALSHTSPASPPPPPSPRARIISPLPTHAAAPPCNMVLYECLGLDSWQATKKEIKTAWRQKALSVHPDRAAEEDREAATLLMQKLNAAVDVLSDRVRRRKYHEDGVLPWAM